ncbi:MAG: hypothetical protein JWO39_2625 [Gemmatimonadetes bacterium]|jgi:hypothetical protein|nr:hypothetical protein [Gemmatimonadota bacterium]
MNALLGYAAFGEAEIRAGVLKLAGVIKNR